MRNPLVSVVIPAYNGERFIGEAIESVLGQTYEPVELVVVDDGSTDSTAQVAAGFPDVHLVSRPNGGPAAARNTGIAASRGEVLAFHDQDDLMLPRKLEIQVSHMLGNPAVEVTVAGQEIVIEEGARMPDWDRLIAPAIFGDAGDEETLILSISLVAWRRVFERIGPFNESIFGGDDFDWILRAGEAGVGMERIDETVVIRRIHAGNISQDSEACRRAWIQCFRNRVLRKRGRDTTPGRELMPFPPPAS